MKLNALRYLNLVCFATIAALASCGGGDAKLCTDVTAGNTKARYSACERACRIGEKKDLCGESAKIALEACKDKNNPDRAELCGFLCMDGESAECKAAKAAGASEPVAQLRSRPMVFPAPWVHLLAHDSNNPVLSVPVETRMLAAKKRIERQIAETRLILDLFPEGKIQYE